MMDFNLILSISVIQLHNCEVNKNKDYQGIEYFLLVMSKKKKKQLQMGTWAF